MKNALAVLLSAAAVLTLGPGCVKKSIAVRSDPPGALVYLDGQEIGRTPVDHVPFDFYGVREIALFRGGYLCERRVVDISAPWYTYFPIDIVSELILPWDIRDRRHYYFDLRRTEVVEVPALMRHAHETREVATAEIEGARRASSYRPRAYVVKGAEKKFILFAPFADAPRAEPFYIEPEEAPKKPGAKPEAEK